MRNAKRRHVMPLPSPVSNRSSITCRWRLRRRPRPHRPRHRPVEEAKPSPAPAPKPRRREPRVRDTSSPSNNDTSPAPVAAMTPPPAPVASVPSTPPPPPPPQKVTIPSGTTLAVRLVDTIDSETSQQGQTFHATLDSPLAVEGDTVIPSGYDVEGHIVSVQSAGKFAGQSLLVLQLDRISAGGKYYNIQTDQYSAQGFFARQEHRGEGRHRRRHRSHHRRHRRRRQGSCDRRGGWRRPGWRSAGSHQGSADQAALGNRPELYSAGSVDGGGHQQRAELMDATGCISRQIRIKGQIRSGPDQSGPAMQSRPSRRPESVKFCKEFQTGSAFGPALF